jgi:hypothetical protein
MITVLVVGSAGDELGNLAGRHASVEVLTAHGIEDALEKLARNRRIDAVLVLDGPSAAGILDAIREDNPAHPPIFAGGPGIKGPGIRAVEGDRPERLLDRLLQELQS